MKRKPDGPKLIKTSISMPQLLMDFANKRVAEEGYSSFSAYLQFLIRADREKETRREKSGPGSRKAETSSSSSYPLPHQVFSRIEDHPKKAKGG